jgi:hypothetical protein
MGKIASDISRRLAEHAEAVCRHYLSNGRRQGRYWLVGDVRNTSGQSLFVRLRGTGSGRGAAGKWTDAATGEHGDLLDVIREACGLTDFRDVLDEARRFLGLPRSETQPRELNWTEPERISAPETARRLFAMGRPIAGTLAETYLRARGITNLANTGPLRFHSHCWYRKDAGSPQAWPALLAAVTDLDGSITGIQRTWLAPDGRDKASVGTPRRAIGHLLGNGVRFRTASDVLAAGEGIETMLALRCALPELAVVAALSANHLAALKLPPSLRRLYVARDCGEPGRHAAEALSRRAEHAGIEALTLTPMDDDFNTMLRTVGLEELCAALRPQLAPEDVIRFLFPPRSGTSR